MKKIGLLKAMLFCKQYEKMTERTELFVAAKESLEGYLPESLKRDLQHLRSAAAAGSEQRQVKHIVNL